MLEFLKLNRLEKLRVQYIKTKADAMNFMKSGDLKNYIKKLAEVQKLRMEYADTLTLQV